jgi:hypothetical protein
VDIDMNKFPEKEFKLTDSELPIKVSQVVDSMERDEAEFIVRGVSAVDRQALETEGNEYEELYPDDYYRGRIVSATTAKNIAENETYRLVQRVSGFVQQKYGLSSGEYISMKVKGYANMSEDKKLKSSRTVANVAESLLPELSPIGLTQGDIDNLRTKAQEFEDGIDLIATREGERRNATMGRINLGNALYSKLAEYCEIGKLIWENINPAFYDDYVIYKTVHHGLSKVQNVQGQPVQPSAINLTWDAVAGAATYEVEWSVAPMGQPQGSFDNQMTVNQPAFSNELLPGMSYVYRVRAKNLSQTGAWSDEYVVSG